MIVFFRRDLKRDFNKRVKRLNIMPGEIRLRFKAELVSTQLHCSSFFEQVGYTAVVVGLTLCNLDPASSFLVKQKNMNAHCRFPGARVKDMRS